jgi:maleylpyruvate isomerase
MRLWEIPFSTNVERVALALAYKGLAVEHVVVDPADRSEVVRISGQELVPVLEADGQVLHDSPAILRWLEEQRPQPPLWPRGARERAHADIFVDWFNHVWKRPPNIMFVEEQKPEPDRARIERWSRSMHESLDRFEALLEGRDYLLGDSFGIADVIAFPFLKYPVLGLPKGDDERFHRILVEHMPLDGGYRRLREWVRRVDERPRA